MDGVRTTDRAWLVARCGAVLAALALAAVAAPGAASASEPSDPTAFALDGLTGYADPPPPAPPAPPAARPAEADPALRTQDVQRGAADGPVPALSSRPGAAHTILLDFDGHRVERGAWVGLHGGQPVDAKPFDRDGRPGWFTPAEQETIRHVWESVSEDYAPFDVDVTTVDPGAAHLAGRSAGTGTAGVRVVVTQGWTGSAAGLALVGTFGRGDWHPVTRAWADIPAWVFHDRLYHDPDNIALAASHEAGHALGLHHDGRRGVAHCTSVEYYCGHPRPAGTWAPIMGAGYDRPITQWSRGEYSGATNTEDDVAILRAALGPAPDDHGDTYAGATLLAASDTVHGLLGIGDVDRFVVASDAGTLRAVLAPASARAATPNLYARLDVYATDGTHLAGSLPNAPTQWSASVAVDVPAGDYLVVVSPIGYSTPDDGFSSYASAGHYRLDVAAVGGRLPTAPVQPKPPTAVAPPSGIVPIPPQRVVDTRIGLGASGRLPAGGELRVDLADALGVAPTAAVLNLTAVAPDGPGHLSVQPCPAARPVTSVVNYAAGQTVANATIATLGPDGTACVYTHAATDVVVDVTGWLAPSAGGGLSPAAPQRLADTRQSGRLAAGDVLAVDVPGDAPTGFSGVAVNLTAVAPDAAGYLTASSCDAPRPGTSTLNYAAGEVRANNAIVAAPSGRLCVYTRAAADVVVDLVGYVTPDGPRYVPAEPTRLVDTRRAAAGPLGAGETRALPVADPPVGQLRAVSLNLAAVAHARPGYVTAYDCGAVPATSTLNPAAGAVVANGAFVPVGAAHSVCVRSLHAGDVLADLGGWWVD